MRLRAQNAWTDVLGASGAEEAWLWDYLSSEPEGSEHSTAVQNGYWDGKVRLYNRKAHRFPTGFVRMILTGGKEQGFTVEIADVREKPQAAWNMGKAPWLRDYQKDAVAALVKRSRGVAKAPTGSGKTEVFIALAASCHIPWLVLVDTKDLMHQAAERFEMRAKEKAGRVGDGEYETRRVTIATVQTLHRRLKEKHPETLALLAGAQGLVVDEVHVLPSDQAFDVAMACTGAYYRFGTSATPFLRNDDRDLRAVGAVGPLIHEVRMRDLEERGLLASGPITFVDFEHERMRGTFAEVYEAGITLNGRRNAMLARIAHQYAAKPALLFVEKKEHGRLMLTALQERGCRSEFVHGTHSVSERRSAITRLVRRDIDVLVCTKIFNKGIDIPQAASGINGAAGESWISAVQKLGRFKRAHPDKASCEFWDVFDKGHRWLQNHSASRIAAYTAEGLDTRRVVSVENIGKLF